MIIYRGWIQITTETIMLILDIPAKQIETQEPAQVPPVTQEEWNMHPIVAGTPASNAITHV